MEIGDDHPHMLARTISVSLAVLAACGSAATAPGTEVLLANVEEDLPADQRRRLVGVITADPVQITFPDGEGKVEVIVGTARMAAPTAEGMRVDLSTPPTYLRSLQVQVVDAAGYEISAALVGNPVNTGTAERPEHTRTIQGPRRRSTRCGTEMSQMSLRAQPEGVTRL